jgi:hypothetical protein
VIDYFFITIEVIKVFKDNEHKVHIPMYCLDKEM